ncbi:hypothetical protein C8J56DRAFT_1091505 [Mycena floridula]|nr:hypothetical protein C8J56DRAFT_1091505 [Mycena floridula]
MKGATISSAFQKSGIWPVDEKAIAKEAFEPAKNFTVKAAQPIPATLPSLLVPIPTVAAVSPELTSAESSTTLPASSPVIPIARSSTPPHPLTSSETALVDAHRTLYRLAMPSPVKGNPSRQILMMENEKLHDLAKAAGVILERSYAQMVLMEQENERLRTQLHAKKSKQHRTYTTGKARLMTSEEMRDALLEDEQKKTMKELHKALAPKLKDRKKKVREFEKMEKAAAMAAELSRGRGRGRGRGGRQGNAEAEPQPGHGRDSPKEPESDCDPEELSPPSSRSPSPIATRASLIPPSSQGPAAEQHSPPSSRLPNLAPAPAPGPSPAKNHAVGEDEDEPDDGEETGITLINGHRWVKNRRNVEFQVLWTDEDVTWEPLSNVDDCAAMDTYLALHDLTDSLLLPKRKPCQTRRAVVEVLNDFFMAGGGGGKLRNWR